MMPSYHIGSLDEASRRILSEGEPESQTESEAQRPVFLDTRVWHKAILHAKVAVSWDTRIFTFKLGHDDQALGLPTGQHLMIRLRDPATREAIIRSYTPISETTKRGYTDVLVKVYYDTHDRAGGKMTKALDSLPIGHFVEFKGPIGKFEYLGRGLCAINTVPRRVKRFFMICGGSGITPIFQVLRAVMQDKQDQTCCVVLDGNRLREDILCKEELDVFARENGDRCRILHTLSKAPEDWTGLRGRIGKELLGKECVRGAEGDALCLICGPEALEKSVHAGLNALGWPDEDLLFF
jgi:nitrate reductase (NAD(P)H)